MYFNRVHEKKDPKLCPKFLNIKYRTNVITTTYHPLFGQINKDINKTIETS